MVKNTESTVTSTINMDNPLPIQKMIYNIRGQQVMLDFDLAKLYGYEVKQFNRQIKRNIERFPEDFMFQLNEDETFKLSRCQTGTSIQTIGVKGGRTYAIHAFTEQGVYMLPSVLKSEIAINQSIKIIRTFKKMRHYLIENNQLLNPNDIKKMENRLYNNEQSIASIKNTMATKDDIQKIMDNFIMTDKIKEFAFLKGEQFEADALFINLYSSAKYSIFIIDNYISIKTLSHLKHKKENVSVTIFTTNAGGKDKLRQVELDDFNAQYPFLHLKYNSLSHDRYIILDYHTEYEKIYHSGASIKDAGKKVCGVNEISDTHIYHRMIEALLKNNEFQFK